MTARASASAERPFDRTLPPAACSGARVPREVVKTFGRAGKLIGKGLRAKTDAKAQRAFRRASGQLGRLLAFLEKAENRRRRPLPAACAAALRAPVGDAKTRVDARLTPRVRRPRTPFATPFMAWMEPSPS